MSLKYLDRFLTETRAVDLTSEAFLKWVETQKHLTRGVRRNRMRIVLLYTTGLRRGELLRLIINDYNIKERSLLIRESKYHKSRYLPLSLDVAREIDLYLRAGA